MFEDKKRIIQPLRYLKEGEKIQRPVFVSMEDNINGIDRFAITKLTHNGKYLLGDLLFYKLNGVEVYTDPSNIIFVDTINNTLFIREHEKVIKEVSPEDPDTKEYIILYTELGYDEVESNLDEFPLRWEPVTGRKAAYENIKINAPVIDIDRSIVLVDTVSVKDALTVRQFMEYIKNSNIIEDESFDIKDWDPSGFRPMTSEDNNPFEMDLTNLTDEEIINIQGE